jgi:sialidase-1
MLTRLVMPGMACLLIHVSLSAQCVVGTNAALSFDGVNDLAAIPSNTSFSGLGDFTVEMWFRVTSAPPTFGTFLDTQPSSGVGRPIWIGLNNAGNLYVSMNWTGLSGPGNSAYVFSSTAAYANGLWHHAAIVRSGGTFSMYADGVAVATSLISSGVSSSAPLLIGSHPIRLGNAPAVSNTALNGSLDEIRAWSVARTPSEICSAQVNLATREGSGLERGLW